ncbi:hypothetical protein EKH55_5037 [Sinorhizobium alkalisoli]|nr:hypothetical protein EKH55_5037 [Sinorhizobium alkalisoli]
MHARPCYRYQCKYTDIEDGMQAKRSGGDGLDSVHRQTLRGGIRSPE